MSPLSLPVSIELFSLSTSHLFVFISLTILIYRYSWKVNTLLDSRKSLHLCFELFFTREKKEQKNKHSLYIESTNPLGEISLHFHLFEWIFFLFLSQLLELLISSCVHLVDKIYSHNSHSFTCVCQVVLVHLSLVLCETNKWQSHHFQLQWLYLQKNEQVPMFTDAHSFNFHLRFTSACLTLTWLTVASRMLTSDEVNRWLQRFSPSLVKCNEPLKRHFLHSYFSFSFFSLLLCTHHNSWLTFFLIKMNLDTRAPLFSGP